VLSEDVLFQSVRELGEGIRGRKLSPVELTESFLERSERLGSKLNAYATVTRELALRPSIWGGSSAPLFGVQTGPTSTQAKNADTVSVFIDLSASTLQFHSCWPTLRVAQHNHKKLAPSTEAAIAMYSLSDGKTRATKSGSATKSNLCILTCVANCTSR
jgi:hypothetical protein